MPIRDEAPSPPAIWLHMLIPSSGLRAYLASLRPRSGDSLQVLGIRQVRPHRSLVQTVAGVEAHAVLFNTSPSREPELRALVALGQSLGGKNLLGGLLPRDEAEWRTHLGESYADLLAKKRTADPRGTLGGAPLGRFGGAP